MANYRHMTQSYWLHELQELKNLEEVILVISYSEDQDNVVSNSHECNSLQTLGYSKKSGKSNGQHRFRTTKELLKIEAQIKIILFAFTPTQTSHPNELVPPIHCSKDVDRLSYKLI